MCIRDRGISHCEGVEEIKELIVDEVGAHIDEALNERLLGILSTKENVNLQTLGFESENVRIKADEAERRSSLAKIIRDLRCV